MLDKISENFLNFEFVYIFFFIAFLAVLFSVFISSKDLKKYLFSVSSVFICLAFAEFILFCVMHESYRDLRSFSLESDYFNFDVNDEIKVWREVEYKNKKTEKTVKFMQLPDEQKVEIDTGENDVIFDVDYYLYGKSKIRYTRSGENKNNNDAFVFLGCSFVFGEALPESLTLPYLFSEKYNFEKIVFNFGKQGRSTNTALNILNSDMLTGYSELKFKHFFYSVIADQVYRNFREPGDVWSSDNILYKDGNSFRVKHKFGFVKKVFIRSIIFRKFFLPLIEEYNKKFYVDYMINSLTEIRNIVKDKYNSDLTVICWEVHWCDEYLIDRLRTSELDVIFLPWYFNDKGYRIENDGHPSEKANKELADILYNHINSTDKGN